MPITVKIFIHTIFPFLFENSASKKIAELNRVLQGRKVKTSSDASGEIGISEVTSLGGETSISPVILVLSVKYCIAQKTDCKHFDFKLKLY